MEVRGPLVTYLVSYPQTNSFRAKQDHPCPSSFSIPPLIDLFIDLCETSQSTHQPKDDTIDKEGLLSETN